MIKIYLLILKVWTLQDIKDKNKYKSDNNFTYLKLFDKPKTNTIPQDEDLNISDGPEVQATRKKAASLTKPQPTETLVGTFKTSTVTERHSETNKPSQEYAKSHAEIHAESNETVLTFSHSTEPKTQIQKELTESSSQTQA